MAADLIRDRDRAEARRSLPKVLSVAEVGTGFCRRPRSRAKAQDASPARPRAQRMHLPPGAALRQRLWGSELVALLRAAARTRERFLIVKGKGAAERLVPLTETARDAVKAYAAASRRPARAPGKGAGLVFRPNSQAGHLQPAGLRRDLKAVAGRGPARRQGQPACAPARLPSDLLQNGADLRVVQELLGHADIVDDAEQLPTSSTSA